MKHQQPLYPIFFEHEDSFKKLGKMWEAIRISKKNQIQDNIKIKLRGWREKNGLEELKEDYLEAVIMKKTCTGMAELSFKLYCSTFETEESDLWKELQKKLTSQEISALKALQKSGFRFK